MAFQFQNEGEVFGSVSAKTVKAKNAKTMLKAIAHGMGVGFNDNDIIGKVGPIRIGPEMNPIRVSMILDEKVSFGRGNIGPRILLSLQSAKGATVWTHASGQRNQGWHQSAKTSGKARGLDRTNRWHFSTFNVDRDDHYQLNFAVDPRLFKATESKLVFEFRQNTPEVSWLWFTIFGTISALGIIGCLMFRSRRL